MRVVLVALCLALAGCMGGDADGTGDGTARDAPTTSDAPDAAELVVEVLNATIDLPAPGGTDALDFDVPAGYLELFIATPGKLVLQGVVRVVALDPAGVEHVLLDDVYAQDGDDGVLRCPDPCTWRLEPTPGTWRIEAEVQGSMHLPLAGRAQ